jgi:hypothetical protein
VRLRFEAVVIFFLFLQKFSVAQTAYPADYFMAPLDGPLVMIGTFGEIRADHFHSGIDLSTNEEEGKKVYAAAAGYISRIKIAPDGYGKALYITHPNGYVTVYGHLKKFNAEIEKYARKIQYKKESFAIDVYPKRGDLPLNKGEVIAFSGSTGAAEGPHLHFEIRDAKTEWVINPLLFGFNVADHAAPEISKIKIYSLNHEGVVINATESATYKVSDESGQYLILGPQVINAFGDIGFGIETNDKMSADDKRYGLGIYSIEMKVDGERQCFFRFNSFSFDETRYANAHVDYGEEILHDDQIQRCYRLPGNKLSMDEDSTMAGDLLMNDGAMHDIEFIVSDFAGNKSSLSLKLQSDESLSSIPFPSPPEDAAVISDKKGININTDDICIKIPVGAVYDETWFSFSKSEGGKKSLSSVYHVGGKTVAVQNPITIEIKPTLNLSDSLQQKMFIASHGKNGTVKYESGEWKKGFLSASARHFGDFEIMIDTTPPIIKATHQPSSDSSGKTSEISFHIADNLSGIESYRATINGKFFLLEYDAKSGTLMGEIPGSNKNKKHSFVLSVSDKKGNTASYMTELIY